MFQILTPCGCQDAVGTCSSTTPTPWGLVESTESPVPQVGPSVMHTELENHRCGGEVASGHSGDGSFCAVVRAEARM